MRSFAFNAVAQVFAFQLQVINFVAGILLATVGRIGHFLMSVIDNDRLKVYTQLMEQQEETGGGTELSRQAMELRLLASAVQVRDHAKETDEWTDRHTDALNAIGDALMVEADWEEASVHQYLKSLVESIDGLEYGTEEW